MIAKLGKYYIFYRHFLYGSALVTAASISQFWAGHSGLFLIGLYISGALLMLSSILVTGTINIHPDEFKEEIKELENMDI